jgi:hypothetical protein
MFQSHTLLSLLTVLSKFLILKVLKCQPVAVGPNLECFVFGGVSTVKAENLSSFYLSIVAKVCILNVPQKPMY